MQLTSSARSLVLRALAYAYAALDDASPRYLEEARRRAAEVLPCISTVESSATRTAEARDLVDLAAQLRVVMSLLDRKLAPAPR